MSEFTHFDEAGRSRMVDVGNKPETQRQAIARCTVYMKTETAKKIDQGGIEKGDVFGVARVAGIMAAKKTPDLIPMCHPLIIDAVDIYFNMDLDKGAVEIEARVRNTGKTGVEMEAMTAVSVAALTVYDMCKAIDKEISIDNIRLAKKSGGKSGVFIREGENFEG